jgi:peptidoglycan lytic transglycosylase
VSPSAAGVAARQEAARRAGRRRAATRRRRSLLALCGVGLLILLVVAVMPDLKKAVRNFTLPLAYQDIIRGEAAAKHLDPALIAAVIYAETKFDARTSPAGAVGLMQIEPQTALFLAHRSGATTFTVADLGTPQVNIAYGSYYLRFLLDHYRQSKLLALAAYNGGEANVDRWAATAHADGHTFTLTDIPFPETRAYVKKVLNAQGAYRRTYPTELGYR